jgi:hypothetical protein
MPKKKASKRSDKGLLTLPNHWRRALAVSLSDLEAELSISLHHPLQPERALAALTRHKNLLSAFVGNGAGLHGAALDRPLPPTRERRDLVPLSDLRPDVSFSNSPRDSQGPRSGDPSYS